MPQAEVDALLDESTGLYNFVSLVKKGIFYSFSMAKTSWISAEHFEHNINSVLDDVKIENTAIPFAAVATDINRGEEVILRNGSLRTAVSASISSGACSCTSNGWRSGNSVG